MAVEACFAHRPVSKLLQTTNGWGVALRPDMAGWANQAQGHGIVVGRLLRYPPGEVEGRNPPAGLQGPRAQGSVLQREPAVELGTNWLGYRLSCGEEREHCVLAIPLAEYGIGMLNQVRFDLFFQYAPHGPVIQKPEPSVQVQQPIEIGSHAPRVVGPELLLVRDHLAGCQHQRGPGLVIWYVGMKVTHLPWLDGNDCIAGQTQGAHPRGNGPVVIVGIAGDQVEKAQRHERHGCKWDQ